MNLDNVKPLDLALLHEDGAVKNKVALLGVELEGGWKELPPGANLERDGSVFGDRRPAGITHIGELPIGPIMPAGIANLIRTNHPSFVDKTCGMHVHMSFSTLWHYTLLMVPEYTVTMTHYLRKWAESKDFSKDHHIWDRLNGNSPFCKNEFYPDLQAQVKRKSHDRNIAGNRYTIIHYCGRMDPPTIECRVLPMMSKASLAIEAVKQVLHITNACIYILGKDRKREKNLVNRITLPDKMSYEETTIELV